MKLLDRLAGRSTERDSFINDSLASSTGMLNRLFDWSESASRERPLSMRFGSKWRHLNCPVMAWYTDQRHSSTHFRSIEHRKSTVYPFYHEFLLLKLTDGAVCRVERLGDGSRTDAVRDIGCTSHDVIQWYSQSNALKATAVKVDAALDEQTQTSELIAEIEYGREFDILDVLAICYSIQRVKPCSVYTLQRYNCYFLCLTVLAVLARRVANWETFLTNTVWTNVVTSAVKLFSPAPTDGLKEHLMIRICAVLEPENLQAAQPIISLLPKYLAPESHIPENCAKPIATILWESVLIVVIDESLSLTLEPQVGELLSEAQGDSATILHQSITCIRANVQREILGDRYLANYTRRTLVDNICDADFTRLGELVAWTRTRRGEHSLPLEDEIMFNLIRRLDFPDLVFLRTATQRRLVRMDENPILQMILSEPASRLRLYVAFRGKQFAEDSLKSLNNNFPLSFFHIPLHSSLRELQVPALAQPPPSPLEPDRSIFLDGHIGLLHAAFKSMSQNDMCSRSHDLGNNPSGNDLAGKSLYQAQIISYYEAVLSTHASSGLTPTQLTLLFNLMLNSSVCAHLLVECISSGLAQQMRQAFESEYTYLVIAQPSQNQMSVTAKRMTCGQFQNAYILPRIQEHRKRVEQVLRTKQETIYTDITTTMAHVWQAMPSGFGAVVTEDSEIL